VELDGSEQSGSGTLVRLAVALAALRGCELRVTRARERRPVPGLRPQHLAAVRACAELCAGSLEGAEVGARDFVFRPGPRIRGGSYTWDIGSAGSTTMLALCVLPLACFADAPVTARIEGGVSQDFAPSPEHLAHVLAPLAARMGATFGLRLLRPGYVPRGGGAIELRVEPVAGALAPIRLEEAGTVRAVRGVSRASHLAGRRVAERMAEACEAVLARAGLTVEIERVDDRSAHGAGAALAVWAESSTGARFGADRAGAPRRSAESIGRFVARQLLADLASGATTDRHAADQVVVLAALAEGTSRWRAPLPTEHLAANLWLVERFGARARAGAGRVEVAGIGLRRGAERLSEPDAISR
jgi:RNA 3'-terminal phosphate cyclase (ATP)